VDTNACLSATHLDVLWTGTRPHAHPCTLLSHKLMQLHMPARGRKATWSRKAASHLGSRFNDWLQREPVLEANYFLPEWQVSSSVWAQMRHLHNETHSIKIRQNVTCWGAVPKQPKSIQGLLSFVQSILPLNYGYCFPSEHLPSLQ